LLMSFPIQKQASHRRLGPSACSARSYIPTSVFVALYGLWEPKELHSEIQMGACTRPFVFLLEDENSYVENVFSELVSFSAKYLFRASVLYDRRAH
jgi:hypothetical protein